MPAGRVLSPNAFDFLPLSPAEVAARGWEQVDVVFVTGDAYVDHPSFAMALLGRLLESEGYRVAILSQPDWRSCQPWRAFGQPRLCFAVSAGNLDSMLNHYTAARKVRNDDAYSPGGQIGRRPDRATLAYCQRAREAFPDVPIIAGGVEASLRRLSHYDFWSDKLRRSIVLDAKPDLLVYGMGERALVEIVHRLDAGEPVRALRDLRGVAYRLGARETPPDDALRLPSHEEVCADRHAFAKMARQAHLETNPFNARRLIQYHGREAVVINPPAMPLDEAEMDRVYGLPYRRRPHPSYGDQPIPAFQVIKDSVQIMRGCFGGCAFCSITAHEGRVIQSRSQQSVLEELRRMAAERKFSGVVSDLGGPTANMYRMHCRRPEVRARCRRLSCIDPTICKLLSTDHGPLVELMQAARELPGVKRVFVASGIRMDLARLSPAYVRELARHHVGGLLKVAPEHCSVEVLRRMKKPPIDEFLRFEQMFRQASAEAGKEQYLVPYFIAGHPGCTVEMMIELAQFLHRTGYRPDKVQDFIPNPMDLATAMYYTGLDPLTGEEVYVARSGRERRLQRALLQFFKPENYFDVHEALTEAGRTDLIGSGPECLIPATPPNAAHRGNQPAAGRSRKPSPGGYRPMRSGARRREKKS
jgi:uncharacterized radical SAM protein YgiQ